MRITYKNLTIRNAEEKDCGQLTAWWNDGKVMAHAGFPNGLGTSSEKIAEKLKGDADDTHRRLILELDGKPIGEMSYRSKGTGVAEIGIKICDADQQEKGYGRVALSMLINELFMMRYWKIVLDTNLKNLRAQHVYELLGFDRVRVNRNSWTDQMGKKQSSVDYELYENQFHNLVV